MQLSPLPLDARPPPGHSRQRRRLGADAVAAAVAADPCDAQPLLLPRDPSTPSTVGEVDRHPTANQGGAAELRDFTAVAVPPIRQRSEVCSGSPAAPLLLAAAALTPGTDLAASARATGADPAEVPPAITTVAVVMSVLSDEHRSVFLHSGQEYSRSDARLPPACTTVVPLRPPPPHIVEVSHIMWRL